jgi:hypothetical protein
MHKLKGGILPMFVIGGLLIWLLLQHNIQVGLREENQSLRQRLTQLTAENERLSRLPAKSKNAATPRLPAPRIQASVSTEPSAESLPRVNQISQILRGAEAPKLTAEQVEPYLKENRRNAGSLLAAARTTGDQALLIEAMQKYPQDPQVAFAAVFKRDSSPEERRHWLEAFEQAAPDNGLANYLSALDHFKAGKVDQAVQELSAASGKQQFQDYSMEFVQGSEEAYRAAGYSVAEAKTLAGSQLLLPQLVELRDLNLKTIELANSYRQAGDETSAQAALQMGANLGQRLQEAAGQSLISKLVGIAIEAKALGALDAAAPYGNPGQTVKDRLDELSQQRATIKEAGQQFESFQQKITDQDWISYSDRRQLFGEEAASQWLASKYGQK